MKYTQVGDRLSIRKDKNTISFFINKENKLVTSNPTIPISQRHGQLYKVLCTFYCFSIEAIK